MLPRIFRQSSRVGQAEVVSMTRHRQHHAPALLFGLVALMLIMVWTSAFLRSSRDIREAEDEAVQQLGNLSLAFAESTISKLQSADQVVRLVRREVQRSGSTFDLSESVDFSGLIDLNLRQIGIIGADGFLSDSSLPFSRVDLSDRQHFRVHQKALDDRLFISLPVVGRVTGQRTLQVTRRINNSDGHFGGVVVLSLATDRLTNIYSSLDLGAQGVITLAGRDGWIRAGRTVSGEQTDQDISQSRAFQSALEAPFGKVWAVSSNDQIERLYSFRHLEQYDLIALVGRSREDIMAQVHELRRVYVGIASLFTLVLLGFSAALWRRIWQLSLLMADLRLSNQKANAANEMKGRILRSVSHELRTPLNGIIGYAELLLEPATAGEIEEYAGAISTSGQQLHRLVNTILDLARVEAGEMSVTRSNWSLAQILADACEPHLATAESRQIALETTVDEPCPVEIFTDRARLLQVLDNVIHNGLKFTEQGGVRVSVCCQEHVLTISVSDTGIGMSSQQLSRVFVYLEATSPGHSHAGQGAGLGLPLARHLVELIGGVLLIDSTPNHGTRVTITLPLKTLVVDDMEGKAS